jgi:hypothetical protein
VPEDLTYLTYAFLHGDIFHLGGNMLFLWVFGDNVEDAMGHIKYLIFICYALSRERCFMGLWRRIADAADRRIRAIAGIVAAYLVLHPRVKIWVLAFGRIPLRIPAYITLLLWIAFQFLMFFAGGDEQVSWSAHIGGILAGLLLVFVLKRRDVPIFDKEVMTPRAVRVDQESAVKPESRRSLCRVGEDNEPPPTGPLLHISASGDLSAKTGMKFARTIS